MEEEGLSPRRAVTNHGPHRVFTGMIAVVGRPGDPEAPEPPAAAGRSLAEESWRRWFEDVAAGRAAALELLYDAFAGPVFGLALWRTGSVEDAGDVVQEVFVRLAERRLDLGRVRNPKAWLGVRATA
jgi:hypothetical protein